MQKRGAAAGHRAPERLRILLANALSDERDHTLMSVQTRQSGRKVPDGDDLETRRPSRRAPDKLPSLIIGRSW